MGGGAFIRLRPDRRDPGGGRRRDAFPPPWNTPEEVLETAQVYGSEAWDGPNLWIPFSEKAPSFGEHPRRQFYLTGLTEREEILTDERTLFSHRMEDGRILYFLDYGPARMPTGT